MEMSRLGGRRRAIQDSEIEVFTFYFAAREGFGAPKTLLPSFEAVMRKCGGLQTALAWPSPTNRGCSAQLVTTAENVLLHAATRGLRTCCMDFSRRVPVVLSCL